MAPGEHARRQPLADGVLGHQQLEHFRTKSLFEQFHGNRRQHDKHAVRAKKSRLPPAIFKRKSPASNEDRAFLLAAAIWSFLIIAATGTGDAIAKGHGSYMPMVFGCQ